MEPGWRRARGIEAGLEAYAQQEESGWVLLPDSCLEHRLATYIPKLLPLHSLRVRWWSDCGPPLRIILVVLRALLRGLGVIKRCEKLRWHDS